MEDNNQKKPRLLKVREVAKVLGVCARQVYKLNASGQLPAPLKIATSVRWREDELMAWIEAGAPDRRNWHWRKDTGNGFHLQAIA